MGCVNSKSSSPLSSINNQNNNPNSLVENISLDNRNSRNKNKSNNNKNNNNENDIIDIENKESKKTNRNINKLLENDRKLLKYEVKLLLLGAGESGKSTILKQMRLIHNQSYSLNEKNRYKEIIFNNIITSIKSIVNSYTLFNIDIFNDEQYTDLNNKQELLDDMKIIENYQFNDNNEFPIDIGLIIINLWKNKLIQNLYLRSNEYQLIDSANYYFNNLDRIIDKNYIPNDQDILRCRLKTTGITELQFTIDNITYKMLDVGGQRSERRKWIHCFEHVTAIVFVVGLSEYDQVLFEDETTNRMQEALTLFDSICNSKWFLNTSIILFLNKIDIFKKKIHVSPLNNVFPDYLGNDDYELATEYIHNRFIKLNQSNRKQIYVQFTCATDTNQMKFVMLSINDIMKSNLKNIGYM